MSKKMLINASHPEENRVAIVVDGVLSELDIEIAGQEQTKGNIYKAVVVRVESGLQAAFVDYGAEKMGFLQIGEIHPSLYPGDEDPDQKNRPRINDILHRGQEILVQIVKEERGTKGAALTTFLSLPGRYMVLMPDSKTKGVSRKITVESERKQLKRTMAELDLPERMGYIVRTAGIGKEQEELKRDFDYLVKVYQGILNHKEQVKAPSQLYQESNLVIRSIRDYFSNEMDEVLIDDSKVYQDAKDFFELVMPEQSKLVKQHRERRPIFSRYQIEEQIDGLSRNQIPLPSGGSIVIDQTEALVAIDVNSGKMSSESGIEATAGKTNLEAAAEVGRQLRLRDLGGLIVIDFIDMRDRKRIREVEQTLRNSLRDDKAKVTIGRISQFGLLEMSRQRIKAALSVGAYLECPHCLGKGRIKSIEAQAVSFLRQAHASSSKGHIGKIEARTPLDVATYLLNEKRAALNDLEKQLNLSIIIEGRPDFVPGQVELELHKRERQSDQDNVPTPISHANQIEDALAAAKQEKTEDQPDEEEQSAAETADTSEESTGRKRRRRRRKRSRKETGEQQASAVETSEENTKEESIEAKEESASPAPEVAKEEPVADKTEKKPRARRSPRKTTAKKDQAETQETASEETVEYESKQEEKPKRRSPRKTAAKKATEAAASEFTPSETTETEKAEEVTKPKRRTTRKPAAKKEAEKQTPEVTASEAEEAKPSADKTEVVEKPKRRTARKSPVKKAVAKATEPAATEEQPAPPSASEEKKDEAKPAEQAEMALEEKPKKRSTARKTVKKDTATAKAEETAKATDTPAETEEKPKRTRRKAAPQKENKSDSTTETATADKPKRRAPRKKAESAQATEAATVAQETMEEAPKRRTRKTAAKKAEEAAGTKEAEAAGAKTKRRAPRKKAEPAQAAETVAAPQETTEEAPKRRTRKTAAKKAKEAAGSKETDSAEAKLKRRAPRKKAPAKTEAGDMEK